MNRRDLLQLGVTGGGLLLSRQLSAQARVQVGGPPAGGAYFTRESPGLWASLVDEHLPMLERQEGPGGDLIIHVTTNRVMEGCDHYIIKHSLLD